MVLAEVQKVEQWKQHCRDVTRASAADKNLLSGALLEVCKHFSYKFFILSLYSMLLIEHSTHFLKQYVDKK